MFNYTDCIDFLKVYEKGDWKPIKKMFLDESFIEWFYEAAKLSNGSSEQINFLYNSFANPKIMKDLVKMFYEVGEKRFSRSIASFIWSVANTAIRHNNTATVNITANFKADLINRKVMENEIEKLKKSNETISKLMKCARKIVKDNAREIYHESGVPKDICTWALQNVPEPKYIDKFRIGSYTNTVLLHLYSHVDTEEDEIQVSPSEWRKFFKGVFGKENVPEIATFILLEGASRASSYKSPHVKDTWDSLTHFALKELDGCPDALKKQMLDLYVKRISKMFANGSFGLRVNLLSLEEDTFPSLFKTIQKYADKISEIVSKATKK